MRLCLVFARVVTGRCRQSDYKLLHWRHALSLAAQTINEILLELLLRFDALVALQVVQNLGLLALFEAQARHFELVNHFDWLAVSGRLAHRLDCCEVFLSSAKWLFRRFDSCRESWNLAT